MWWQEIACRAGIAVCLLFSAEGGARAAENFTIKTLVPTFGGPTNLGANVSTILALRLWTTLRPRPNPNPDRLYFGVGHIEWSRRVIDESPDAAVKAAVENRSHLALWGAAEEYGPGVVVTSNLVIPASQAVAGQRQTWTVTVRNVRLELGLPGSSYQFSPLVISNDVVSKYSRPNQIRVCPQKRLDCDGPLLGNPFRAIRLDGDFVQVRQPSGTVGWVALPNLSEAQGEVVDFTAALISYHRGDFEQAERYFTAVRDSKSESLVRNDAALLAGISIFRRGLGIEALDAAQRQNPYSRFAVQALVMATLSVAAGRSGEARQSHLTKAKDLIAAYRHLFEPNHPWLLSVEQSLRVLN
jgi:hypothetical protein